MAVLEILNVLINYIIYLRNQSFLYDFKNVLLEAVDSGKPSEELSSLLYRVNSVAPFERDPPSAGLMDLFLSCTSE